jgi:hypothetical protein
MPPAWIIHSTDENCALLGYYTANSGNSLPILEDGAEGLYRNVGFTTKGCVIAQKGAVLIYFAAEAWNHEILSLFSRQEEMV